MPDIADPPATPAKPKGFFTKENACHYAALGQAARRLVSNLKHAEANSQQPTGLSPALLNDFQSRRLVRVRAQLDRIDYMLITARDSKRIKELTDASTRLSEQERILAGRPLPGTKRPPAEGARRSREVTALLVDEVKPAVQVAPVPEVAPGAMAVQGVGPSSTPPDYDRLPGDVTP